jgi:hypothetical protein
MPTDPEEDRDSESSTSSEKPSRSERPRKKKVRRPKTPQPVDEAKINTPDIQTLGMLGVIGVVTLVLWALAHAACNYHPPRETRRPRVVKTEEWAREPKTAAVEAVQRLALLNHAGALELSAGSFAEEVKKAQAACAADKAGCAAKKAAAANAQSMGILLDRDIGGARVRVVTRGVGGNPKAVIVRVEREGAGWKATAMVPEDAAATLPGPVLPPPANPHAGMMQFEAAPAGSGAPGGPRIVIKPKSPDAAPAAPAAAASAN